MQNYFILHFFVEHSTFYIWFYYFWFMIWFYFSMNLLLETNIKSI